MKMLIAAVVSFALAGSVSAQTTPLTSSQAFQAKANTASPTFSGTATFQGRVNLAASNTPQFFADGGTDGGYINFAASTLFDYSIGRGQYEFYVGGFNAAKLAIGSSTASFTVPVTVPALNVSGGTEFGLGMNSGRPFIKFDGMYSRIEFDSTGNYVFYQANKKIARLDGNGNLYLRGSVGQNLGSNCC